MLAKEGVGAFYNVSEKARGCAYYNKDKGIRRTRTLRQAASRHQGCLRAADDSDLTVHRNSAGKCTVPVNERKQDLRKRNMAATFPSSRALRNGKGVHQCMEGEHGLSTECSILCCAAPCFHPVPLLSLVMY